MLISFQVFSVVQHPVFHREFVILWFPVIHCCLIFSSVYLENRKIKILTLTTNDTIDSFICLYISTYVSNSWGTSLDQTRTFVLIPRKFQNLPSPRTCPWRCALLYYSGCCSYSLYNHRPWLGTASVGNWYPRPLRYTPSELFLPSINGISKFNFLSFVKWVILSPTASRSNELVSFLRDLPGAVCFFFCCCCNVIRPA